MNMGESLASEGAAENGILRNLQLEVPANMVTSCQLAYIQFFDTIACDNTTFIACSLRL